MLNILWSLLNAALLLGFLYIFFRAAKLLKQYVGLGASLFFIFGLLTIGCGRSGEGSAKLPPKNLLAGKEKDIPLGNGNSHQQVALGGSNTLNVLAEYYKQDDVIRPRGLFATVSGLTLGHHWQPLIGTLTQHNMQLHYELRLKHEWLLLGTPVYVTSTASTGLLSE
ncbi:hypothetical protein [Hymenobacter volaticus]|uniref:Uncharacterized protein n=1 Tax=Hymenobacter volaticus TaxID=2932254 RepID=A0ABY4G4B1_9BACT|nr:hypothetical protein [Hymenobacter volaticus]UOQ65698.1 hypothetical protein MUN86_19530 [Hymenobacter volaticus]